MTRFQADIVHVLIIDKPYFSHALETMLGKARRIHAEPKLSQEGDDLGLASWGKVGRERGRRSNDSWA
eukprot:3665556-Pyramimonas_sp.AAC.1